MSSPSGSMPRPDVTTHFTLLEAAQERAPNAQERLSQAANPVSCLVGRVGICVAKCDLHDTSEHVDIVAELARIQEQAGNEK